jgi:hypothetical protein
MAVPNIFANVTTSIPLSQLDTNFATAITLGNTAVYLGNTTTTLGNLTLTNVNIASGTSNLASTSIANGTSNVSVVSSGGNVVVSTNGATAVTVDTGQRTTFPTTIGVGAATPSTSGSGITFPATPSLSTNVNTLDEYTEGSFTVTGTGFTATITGTAYYTKIGNSITLSIPDLAGTSNTTGCTATGLPVALRASTAFVVFALVYNASLTNNGHLYNFSGNTISIYWDSAENAFTASGVKGIINRVSIAYTLT